MPKMTYVSRDGRQTAIDDAWAGKVAGPNELERELLEGATSERKPSSRLPCQIDLTDALDGPVIRMPETQL